MTKDAACRDDGKVDGRDDPECRNCPRSRKFGSVADSNARRRADAQEIEHQQPDGNLEPDKRGVERCPGAWRVGEQIREQQAGELRQKVEEQLSKDEQEEKTCSTPVSRAVRTVP